MVGGKVPIAWVDSVAVEIANISGGSDTSANNVGAIAAVLTD